jgi:Ca-activated chloride channel homolog
MVQVTFFYPVFLFLLFLAPFFILVYFLGLNYSKKKSIMFGNFDALQRVSGNEIFSRNFLALYLNIAILVLLIFSLAGTILIYNAETASFSYVIAIDNSISMSASDLSPTRLEVAKDSARNFIDSLPSGVEVAVLSFSGDARIMQEINTNKIKTKAAINAIDFGTVQGTNIYNAVIGANQLLEEATGNKALVLIGDGQLNVGDTPEIIRYAEVNEMLIHTIAVGTSAGGENAFGVISKVDEDVLKSLAFNTQGSFFRANNSEGLEESLQQIVDSVSKEISMDVSFYLLLIAIGLFSLSWILSNFRFRVLP